MADTDPSERSDRACNLTSTANEDEFMQSEVLLFVLELHPDLLTVPELVTEFCKAGEEAFRETDAVKRAARDLIGAGLLRRLGDAVAPTRAALHYHRIDRS